MAFGEDGHELIIVLEGLSGNYITDNDDKSGDYSYDCHVNNYDDVTLLRPDEVAKALGITVDSVYKWCRRGCCLIIGWRKLSNLNWRTLQEFLAQRRIEPN